MKTSELRQKFLKFFESKGHTIVRSSSLVPHDARRCCLPTPVLNQFKDVFLGSTNAHTTAPPPRKNACAPGGKHNDLENVG